MDRIFTRYGAVRPEIENLLYNAETLAYQNFLSSLPKDVSLEEKRVLFYIFQSGLLSRMSENLLHEASIQRKSDVINQIPEGIKEEVDSIIGIDAGFIERIKAVRQITDFGLVESKNIVEELWGKKML